ncbi:MAG: HPF/RaiA family ribosome-associated protein [Planctomycetes bacterium]|nr:HPF/RaiA family ribosome-associated protein [Planctomycetota bacterium]
MKLYLHWNGLEPSPTLREHLERRLAFALGRFGAEVTAVRVWLADTNGPRGGVDKQVRLLVLGPQLRNLVVTDSDSSLLAAIDRGADRIGNAIRRALERARSLRRR